MAKTGSHSTRVHACRTRSQPSVLLLAVIAILSLLSVAPAVLSHKIYDNGYGPIIGIHLGTTSSCVAFEFEPDPSHPSHVEIIVNEQGHRTTPAWVVFEFGEHGERRLVGAAAKNVSDHVSMIADTGISLENIVFDARRLIGRTMEDPEVQNDIQVRQWPFKVYASGTGSPAFNVNVKNGDDDEHQRNLSFTPEEISGMVLRHMKEIAEAYLGAKVEHAIITVPTYFNDAQRQATKDAGALAGLQVLRVMNEPMAAVKAYGLDKISGQQDAWKRGESVSHIFVYHLGGATLDATLLKLEDGVVEVLGDVHDSHLGGERFNSRVVNHLRELHQRDTNVNTKEDLPAYAMRKLKLEVERAKRTLSSQQSTHIDVDIKNDKIISKTLTRAKFEELNDDLFRETIKSVEQVLQEAGVKKDEVDNVILVGGSTRIPKIQQLITEYFNKEPLKGIEPDEVLAHGAAVLGGVLNAPFDDRLCMLEF